jgi:two-component system OmpR family response regulator
MPEALRTRREVFQTCNRSGNNVTVVANTPAEIIAEAGATKDVVILRWPEQSDRIDDLERLGVPRLLLVEKDSPPPPSTSCIEDWLRLPVDDDSLRARLVALAAHARRHPMVPSLDEHGQLSHRGEAVFLSLTDQRIAQLLIENFGHVVSEETLLEHARPEARNDQTLRVNVSRLRRRIAPLGLAITCVRGHGYLMQQEIGHFIPA